MTKLIVAGAAGRMGCALIRCAAACPDMRIVGAVERSGEDSVGKDAGVIAGLGAVGVPVLDNLKVAPAADVLIDFSFHTATRTHAEVAAQRGMAMVIGTTGLTDEDAAAVRKAARKIAIVCAPNMSLGVNLMFALVRRAAETLGVRYDVEIVETHHRFKKDAPSGTALRLAREVAEARSQDLKTVGVYGRLGLTGERPEGQIALHALRMGDVVGDHVVTFAVDGEQLQFTHRATSRDTFAAGALRAAAWVAGRAPGLYDMLDVLGLRS